MKNYKKSSSLIILCVALVTMCASILLPMVNAWFTAGSGKNITLVAHIANININIYQVTSQGSTLINPEEPTYIDLTNEGDNLEIIPDTSYSLTLRIQNDDTGTSSFSQLRYKVEFFASTPSGDQEITGAISGFTAPSGGNNGFVYVSSDGYYYYRSSSGANQVFESGAGVSTPLYIMTTFSFPYSSFVDSSGNSLFNGNNLKIVVTVDTY